MNSRFAKLIITSTFFPLAAQAQSAGCSDIDGFTSALVQVRVSTQLTANPLTAGEVIRIQASSVVSSEAVGTPVWAFADTSVAGFGGGAFSPILPSSATPVDVTETVPSGGISQFGLTETGPFSTDLADVTISCTGMASLPVGEVVEVAEIATHNTQSAMQGALGRNFSSRFGRGPSDVASRDLVFVSTRGGAGLEGGAWLSLTTRMFFDGYEGAATDFLVGADSFVGDGLLIGAMFGAGNVDVETAGGARTEADALTVGIYAASEVSGGFLVDGHIAYSWLDYDAGGTRFSTDRVMAGVNLSRQIALAAGTLTPRASLSGSVENFPAGTGIVTGGEAQRLQVSAGARFDWNATLPGSQVRPYASFDVEYATYENTVGTTVDYLAPRIGFGLEGSVGGGRFSAGLDFGQSGADVYDAGFRVAYEVSF